jgi:methionyl aminopeptidase
MEPLEALHKAGKIAAQVRNETVKQIKPGSKVIDICDMVQTRLKELGGKPAFPTNVDINQVAAHYCSPIGDLTTIPARSLVKLDIGVHVEGYIADTAKTVCFNPGFKHLVEAAEAGLHAAINTVRPGVRASYVGASIEEAIKAYGLQPIRNLTGHKLTRYMVHAGASIPNINGLDHHILQVGEVYAIEPFAVPQNAAGKVIDGPPSNIYRLIKKRSVKGLAKKMQRYIQTEFRTLPFASRWIMRKFPGSEGKTAFNELLKMKNLMSYPQLIEKTQAMVAQAEHTVIVTEDGCEVTTT